MICYLPVSVVSLQVDYKEKAAAGGQIPKTFFRKDVILSERETIVSRRIGMRIFCVLYSLSL